MQQRNWNNRWVWLLLLLAIGVGYVNLIQNGKRVYLGRSAQVESMMVQYPRFFEAVFGELFPNALACSHDPAGCVADTRAAFDRISAETGEVEVEALDYPQYLWIEPLPFNQQPLYFVRLLEDGTLAKLFFSGDLKIEEIDTREERMVRELLLGTKTSLYGPYYGQEAFLTLDQQGAVVWDWRIFKPAYLKDLYSQVEVLVPYSKEGNILGAVVYLHGQ